MKLSPHPNGCGRCAASRLSAPFCAILTAMLLFACASAQAQWTKGNTYYGASTVTQADSHTTPTKTANSGTATIGLQSVPTNDYNGYMASGKLYGYVYQDFIWTGPQPQGNMQVGITESDSGSITSGSSASAQSSVDAHSDATNQPYTLSYSGTYPRLFGTTGGSRGISTNQIWISVQTQVYYPSTGSATSTVTWGNPYVYP